MNNDWYNLFSYPEIDINIFFDKIYYINLDSRTDRLESMRHELVKNSIIAQRVAGIIPDNNPYIINNGQLGCLLSHLSIITDAIINDYNTILILEDDTIFKENFAKLFSRFVHYLPVEWHMIYLCGNHFGGIEYLNDQVYKSYGTLSTNAYGIHKSIFNKLYTKLTDKPYCQPVDSIYCSLHKDISAYASVPNLCYQMAGFSDIENKITDYDVLK